LAGRVTIEHRLAKLDEVLKHLRSLARVEGGKYPSDPALQAQVERWLQVAAQCVIDTAHHLVAARGWRTPRTYLEAFGTLKEKHILPPELADQMEKWGALRDLLAYEYLHVDPQAIFSVLSGDLNQLSNFIAAVKWALQEGG
jgi:uncharacterized protein YutE (UPF0331/DUF86 family)